MNLTAYQGKSVRIPYTLRRIPPTTEVSLLPFPGNPRAGDIALARLEKIGKNTAVELADGRRCGLHDGDLVAVVFGNRYATRQFEGYAAAAGDRCDLLSMGGLCGLVSSKHSAVSEPSRLRLLHSIGDAAGNPLRLGAFRVSGSNPTFKPRVVVVCGTSMDSGKTHTAMSLIMGLQREGRRVAGIKLTGTGAGRDTWTMRDAGACVALDFIDGGLASTFLCSLGELLELKSLLVAHAASQGADWVVIEIADGLLQRETAMLLQSARFTQTVDAWVFAASEPLAAAGGLALLGSWGISPLVISGLLSMSPLEMRETEAATKLSCMTAHQLQNGELGLSLSGRPVTRPAVAVPASRPGERSALWSVGLADA